MEKNPVLSWYEDLPTRVVDLVGDYAGSNLLVVEGDSLLLTCFSDPDLDFDDGFQLLHAIFLVERYLQRLIERKCNLKIVFFNHHSRLCIPPHASFTNEPKYLLAREVAIRHLRQTTQLDIQEFARLLDGDFKQYLDENDVYCFLCHDGNGFQPRKRTQCNSRR